MPLRPSCIFFKPTEEEAQDFLMEEPAVPRRGLGCLGADPNTPSDYIKYEQGCERSAGGAVALQCYLHLLEKTKIAQIMSNSLLKCE